MPHGHQHRRTTLQENKRLVWELWQAGNERPADLPAIAADALHRDVAWTGPQPLNRLDGRSAVVEDFWRPLVGALPDLQRRSYLFFGGTFEGGDWVCSSGDLIGTFAHDWLGIPASGSSVRFRFGEFCRLEDGKIREVYLLLDLLELMSQVGFRPLPPSLGAEIWVPGPRTGDGVLTGPQDPAAAAASLALVEAMLGGLMSYDGKSLESMGQERFWRPEMRWYGPHGIGTTSGLKGFQDLHQRPFLEAFPDRGGGRNVRFGDGNYAALVGWESLFATHRGSYLGLPASGRKVAMRVMDFWRVQGDKIAENWVLIDMIDLFGQLGVDLLARLREQLERQRGE